MPVNRRHCGTRDRWSLAGALVAAVSLLLMLVLPATATSGPTGLSDPEVSPRSEPTRTVVVARVWYRSHDGSEVESVWVTFGDGPARAMSALPGGFRRNGARFGPGGSGNQEADDSSLAALRLFSLPFDGPTAGPTAVTTTGALTMSMAFGLFGKRRRVGEPPAPDDQLAAAAALGVGLRTLPAFGEAEDPEAQLPRWRRPSLLEARRTDPIRDATAAPRLTFDQGLVGPLDGHERRLIRYRLVRMLDTPDELRGTEMGYLDRDDEVQLLEKHGAYWLVLCPDGRQGWVHNMTLGEVIHQAQGDDRPIATLPLAADTWTAGEGDEDTDVLNAYLESRRRRA